MSRLLVKAAILTATTTSLVLSGCEKNSNASKLSLGYSTLKATSATQERIQIVPVIAREESNYVRLTGSLQADEKSDVASRVGGIVLESRFERGSVVNKGDVLIKLDPTDAENQLAEGLAGLEELEVRLGLENGKPFNVATQPEVKTAKAALDLALANFKRDQELFNRKIMAKADFDRTSSEYDAAQERYNQSWHQAAQLYQSYKTAQTRLRTLRKAVEDTSITAPFSGIVMERTASVGERVVTQPMGSSGGKIATLVKIDPLRLVLTVPEQSVAAVKLGLPVEFTVEAYPNRVFQGKIIHIAPALESSSRSLTVEARVDNPTMELHPGFFASARLLLPERTEAIYVPTSAVRRANDVARLFVAQDGVARETIVETGDTSGSVIRVLSGVQKADQVVADAINVTDGTSIK